VNRAARRRLSEATRARLPKQDTVVLVGGPMAGVLVKAGAPVFRLDWWSLSPRSVKARWLPGRYIVRKPDPFGIVRADWVTEGNADVGV